MAIPFYGADDRDLFAIERRAMDKPGRVVRALDARLPTVGTVVDIGAGDGFTAEALQRGRRRVVAVEPAEGMRRPERALPWVGGVAEALPLRTGTIAGAYATWAYFFTGPGWDPSPGIEELHRVVAVGGPLVIVDNVGGDEFTALAPAPDIVASVEQWTELGFTCDVVETVFEFDDEGEAKALLTSYFPEAQLDAVPLRLSYRVGIFTAVSLGPAT